MLELVSKFLTALGLVVIIFFLGLVAYGQCTENQQRGGQHDP